MEPEATPPRDVRVDHDEIGALYARCCPPLIGLLTAVGGSRADAEEVAQEAFVRLIEHWAKVSGYAEPEVWLRRVAIRLLISRQRRRQVAARGLALLRLRAERQVRPDSPHGDVDLTDALHRLPIGHRAVVLLHHVHDLSVEDVATQLDLPVGTVKSRLSRARAALAESLAEDERSLS